MIRLNDKTVHVAGDTALFGDRDLIGDENLDVAIIPIGGQYTMDATDASRPSPSCVRRFLIAGHYNTFPTIGSDPVAFAEAVAASTKARAVVLEPGQSAEVWRWGRLESAGAGNRVTGNPGALYEAFHGLAT